MIEFRFETTRAVANMLLTGTFDRFPDIRLIVPHAGAAVPVLADRIAGPAFHPRKAKQCSEPPPSD